MLVVNRLALRVVKNEIHAAFALCGSGGRAATLKIS
jgi:hypothetical protein